MESLNYLHLYYFWIASKERGFLKASKKLGMSQSTISTQLQLLEKQLGCRLVDRGPRLFELTDDGRVTFEYCETIFHHGENLVRSLRKEETKAAQLRVGFETHLSLEVQSRFFHSLMDSEGLMFKVELGSAAELIRKVNDRQLDVVISNTRPSPTADRLLKSRPLLSSSAVLVGKKKWRRKKGRGVPDLANVPLFLPPLGTKLRGTFDQWTKQKKLAAHSIRVESENASLLKRFALQGQGVCLIPKICVLEELKSDEISVFQEFRDHQETFHALYLAQFEKHSIFKATLEKF